MRAIVLGDGPMGRAMGDALLADGHDLVVVAGRPAGRHAPGVFAGVDVAFEFSRGDAVLANVEAALEGGCRRLVIGTTAWDGTRDAVGGLLEADGAAAVASASFSPGVALLGRLVDAATRLFGPMPAYDPFIVEWHRGAKADRPSGTALALSRRILAVHPVKRRLAEPGRNGRADPDELEVASVRAGSSPGVHVVGYDAPGETLELRLTARDRSAYAAGALAAAHWLLAGSRPPGLHAFDEVIDDLASPAVVAMA